MSRVGDPTFVAPGPDDQFMPYDPHHGGGPQFASAAEMHSGMGMGTMGTQGPMTTKKIESDTGRAPRRCTDLTCCCFFAITVILLVTIRAAVGGRGNVWRLSHGTDYYGRICGIDNGVENMPFLFWCRKDGPSSSGVWSTTPSDIELLYPTCVVSCPTEYTVNSAQIACLVPSQPEGPFNVAGGAFGSEQTLEVSMTENIVLTAPYATFPRGGRFCVPQDETLRDKVMNSGDALGPSSRYKFNVTIGTLHHLYFWMMVATFLSCVLSMLYFFSMKHCPKAVSAIFLVPMTILFLLGFIFFILALGALADQNGDFGKWYHEKNPCYRQLNFEYGTALSVFISLVCLGFSLMLCTMFRQFMTAQNTMADLLNSARECINFVPCMFLTAWFEAFFKYIIFYIGCEGVRWICSVGWLDTHRIQINGVGFAGLSRTFNYWDSSGAWTTWIWFYVILIFWIFGMFWCMEICTCFGQFMTSYATVAWYYSPKEGFKKERPPIQIFKGFYDGWLYHFGSICKGAFKIPPTRPIRLGFWLMEMLAPSKDSNKGCCSWCGSICNCLSAGFCGLHGFCERKVWEKDPDNCMATKDAFTDIVVRSNDYHPANVKACQLLQHSHKVVQMLYRDFYNTTSCVMGIITISSACAFFVYLFVNELDRYKDEGSPFYVPDPILVAVLTWILSAYVSFGFMTVWEHTADALLCCYCWNRIHDRKSVDNYIPETLRAIVGYDDTENDRYPYYGKANNNMYLRYWLPAAGKKPEKIKEKIHVNDMPPQMPTPQPSMMSGPPGHGGPGGDPSMFSGRPNSAAGMEMYPGEQAPLMASQHH